MTRPIVMNDVAQLAGVSIQTVSRVLNEHPSVRPQTRARVLEAIARLDYRPNLAARSLAAGRNRSVGVLLTSALGHGSAMTFAALAEAAGTAGYHLVLATASEDDPSSIRAALDQVDDHRVLATVVLTRGGDIPAPASRRATAQRVLLTAARHDAGVCTVSTDHVGGARAATTHLIESGRSRLVHVAGDLSFQDAALRRSAFSETCAAYGVRGRVEKAAGWTPDEGYRVGRALLSDLPDGVFAANDELAIGIARAFAEAGVRVPEDVGLVGFDDIPVARFLAPALTTVVQDFAALGRFAIEQVARIERDEEPVDVLVPARLVVRESSARPR